MRARWRRCCRSRTRTCWRWLLTRGGRCGEFCTATGLATGKAQVEGVRSRLRRLAARGWLAGEPGGLYSPGAYAEKASSGGR